MLTHVKDFLVEVATLKRPVTAGAAAAFLVTATNVFGIHLSGEAVAGILVGIGTIAAAAEKLVSP